MLFIAALVLALVLGYFAWWSMDLAAGLIVGCMAFFGMCACVTLWNIYEEMVRIRRDLEAADGSRAPTCPGEEQEQR